MEHVRYDVWKPMANFTVNVPESLKKKMEQVLDVNWNEVAREAFEETIRQKQTREAAEAMDKLREFAKAPGWSGAREIRRWRDTQRKSGSTPPSQ